MNDPNLSEKMIDDIIAKVIETRSKNDLKWMEILRIALKYAPLQTSDALDNILECDSGAVNIGKMELERKSDS